MPVIKRLRISHLLILRDRPRIVTKPKEQMGSVPARGAAEDPPRAVVVTMMQMGSVPATCDRKTAQGGSGGRLAAHPCSARTGPATYGPLFCTNHPWRLYLSGLRLMAHLRGKNPRYRGNDATTCFAAMIRRLRPASSHPRRPQMV